MHHVVPGQRWISDNEPELGLGIVLRVATGRVEIMFPAAEEPRQYALASAPLRRVAFREGDKIRTHDGTELIVQGVEERGGLFVYRSNGVEIAEADLSDTISFSSPEERLLAGHVDDVATYELRAEAIEVRSQIQGSPVRGYVGGRIDLIPHQLSIAGEVASRLTPRVLLADEVGLGKTIEAGMILHRLHLTGRAERALILTPGPLVHQWFVELLRRFNLPFAIFDEERCESIEQHDKQANPFLDSQLVLADIGLLADSRRRARQALDAGWDILIVDEAHHLEWSPEFSSIPYRVVESLARSTAGLLLLTATPQQLGPESHFARLRLLDPVRYADLDSFLGEATHYEAVARTLDHLLDGNQLTAEDHALFADNSERIRGHARDMEAGVDEARERLVEDLLDSFGTGRVMFRNTRSALTGFPERRAHLVRLESTTGTDSVITRVKWLADLLRQLPEEKLLVICRTREMAEEIHRLLAFEINTGAALFHEGLTLLQRDRNAAYFAVEDGARVLICSEIGSEGRNFQFAHHLVLFDLPRDPELLEQRIGRLDRIGQTEMVNIHVPWMSATESEVLARWYHEGLNAFEENLHGAAEIAHALESQRAPLLESFDEAGLLQLIEHSQNERLRVAERLEHGYDRLLQRNSNKPERAREIARHIEQADNDPSFEEFVVRLLEYFGVLVEELSDRTYLFRPGHILTDEFPALPDNGMTVTFDRRRALSREDIGFLTWDHPFIRSVIDLLADGEQGNSSFAIWRSADTDGVLLELCTIVECVAPPALHVDRFLPPTPLRIVVDQDLENRTDDAHLSTAPLRNNDISELLAEEGMKTSILPALIGEALDHAEAAMARIIEEAKLTMSEQLQGEIDRLEDLRQINSDVSREEVAAVSARKVALDRVITKARLRVAGLRVVQKIA